MKKIASIMAALVLMCAFAFAAPQKSTQLRLTMSESILLRISIQDMRNLRVFPLSARLLVLVL